MDTDYLGSVRARLQPLIRDGAVQRSRIQRVLAALQSRPSGLEAEIERLLVRDGLEVKEDAPPELGAHVPAAVLSDPERLEVSAERKPSPDGEPLSVHGGTRQAVQAAQRVLAVDRNRRHPERRLLTAEEEVGLSLLLRQGAPANVPLPSGYRSSLPDGSVAASAFDAMVLHNQRLVWSIAKKTSVQGMENEDVIQFGVLGLIRAVEMFDPSKGFKFSTYSTWWIRQSIDRGVMNTDRLVRLPVHVEERVRTAMAVRESLRTAGSSASPTAVAERMGVSAGEVEYWLRLAAGVVYLDSPINDDGDTLGDVVDVEASTGERDPVFERASQSISRTRLEIQMWQVLDTLSEREAGVVALRHGLIDWEPKTLDEIGKVYGLTRERIRQIEGKTIQKLRHPSRSQTLREFL